MPTDFSDTVLGYMNAARNFGVDLGKSLVSRPLYVLDSVLHPRGCPLCFSRE